MKTSCLDREKSYFLLKINLEVILKIKKYKERRPSLILAPVYKGMSLKIYISTTMTICETISCGLSPEIDG